MPDLGTTSATCWPTSPAAGTKRRPPTGAPSSWTRGVPGLGATSATCWPTNSGARKKRRPPAAAPSSWTRRMPGFGTTSAAGWPTNVIAEKRPRPPAARPWRWTPRTPVQCVTWGAYSQPWAEAPRRARPTAKPSPWPRRRTAGRRERARQSLGFGHAHLLLQAHLWLDNRDLALQALDRLSQAAAGGDRDAFFRLKEQARECQAIGLGPALKGLMGASTWADFLQPFALALGAAAADERGGLRGGRPRRCPPRAAHPGRGGPGRAAARSQRKVVVWMKRSGIQVPAASRSSDLRRTAQRSDQCPGGGLAAGECPMDRRRCDRLSANPERLGCPARAGPRGDRRSLPG